MFSFRVVLSGYSSAGSSLSSLLVSLGTVQSPEDEFHLEYRVENLLGEGIVDWQFVGDTPQSEVSLTHSGEFMILIRSHYVDKEVEFQLTVDCTGWM